jgi:hypothetical protein
VLCVGYRVTYSTLTKLPADVLTIITVVTTNDASRYLVAFTTKTAGTVRWGWVHYDSDSNVFEYINNDVNYPSFTHATVPDQAFFDDVNGVIVASSSTQEGAASIYRRMCCTPLTATTIIAHLCVA